MQQPQSYSQQYSQQNVPTGFNGIGHPGGGTYAKII
jgi:hypothetical protein